MSTLGPLPSLPKLTAGQLVTGLTALAKAPWADLEAAATAHFANPTADLVALDDLVAIAAAFGVPDAALVNYGLQALIMLIGAMPANSQQGLPVLQWIPPWAPGYIQPTPNKDPLRR